MKSYLLIFLLIMLNVPVPLSAQRKTIAAVFTEAPPKLDGNLNDDCWKDAPIATGFINSYPKFGVPSPYKTDVKIVYDNDAIYVSAYLYDDQPNNIPKELCERDGSAFSDYFIISFDTYNDKQNGYRFVIRNTGVVSDAKITNGNLDFNWDAVWETKAVYKNDGWVTETRIPYSAIRFPKKEIQDWNVQFSREHKRSASYSQWAPIDPAIAGVLNQWGQLTNLKNIDPPLRLSYTPYLSSSITRIPSANKTFRYHKYINGGADIKWGINESFTLDMTLIPDFGQVQSDYQVLNLSPYEVKFDELRPFFTEGSELFNDAGIFYSRRIGKRPPAYYAAGGQLKNHESILDNPSETKLINAIKFSGRTKNNVAIGIFNSVTSPMYATILNDSSHATRIFKTAALTNYNVFVLQKTLKYNSAVSFTNTNMLAEGNSRKANVSVLKFNFRNKKNSFEWAGNFGTSIINDTKNSSGISYRTSFSKIGGTWLYGISHGIDDDEYNYNDLGLMFRNNLISNRAYITYNGFKPQGIFNNFNYTTSVNYNLHYKPAGFESFVIGQQLSGQFKNQWEIFFPASYHSASYDYFEPRVAGRKFRNDAYIQFSPFIETDGRKDLSISSQVDYIKTFRQGANTFGVTVSPQYRFSHKLKASLDLLYNRQNNNRGFVALNNNDIIFGERNITTFSSGINSRYIFSPKSNITFRARHYWSKVQYASFYKLQNEGTLSQPIVYATNNDRNFNTFNIDFVYTWYFAPGSQLNIIWKNNFSQDEQFRDYTYLKNLSQTFAEPHNNIAIVKILYYLDHARVKHLLKK